MKYRLLLFFNLILIGWAGAQISPSTRSQLVLNGRIVDTAGIGVVGAQIMVWDTAAQPFVFGYAATTNNGFYTLRVLGRSSGTLRMRVEDCAGNIYLDSVLYSSSLAATRNFTVQCRVRVPNPPPPPPLRPCDASFGFRPDTNALTLRFSPAVVDTLWTYRWSFGDGNTSNQVSPSHTYANGGMYTVRLIVSRLSTTAGASCSDTESRVVNIPTPPRPPVSNPWSVPCNPRFGARVDTTLTVQFRSVLQDTTANYAWNFGDGSTSNGRNPSHTYTVAGSYVVVLRVSRLGSTASTSCSDTAWMRISVPGYRRPRVITNPRPVPPASPCQAQYLVATDTQPLGYVFAARPVLARRSYSWNFGDGSTATGPVVRHTYASAASYTVCLTVVDSAANCTSMRCDTLVASSLRSSGGGIGTPRVSSTNPTASRSVQGLELYPNPVHETLHLVLGAGQGQAVLRVMDLTGRIVATHTFKASSITQRESMAVHEWPAGTYVVTLDRDGKREYKRFVKQ
ncbi:MAG: PKD domain-containing protein [Bacteroidota bacterium]